MPTDKDFKRLVRARMRKTGEAYTTARANLQKKSATSSPRSPRAAAAPVLDAVPPDYAALAGMSDAAIKAKTGCTWEKWVYVLDRKKAHEWPHKAIAEYIYTTYKVPGWWGQTVTVGYERIKGLRQKGQRREGGWEASKSRTFTVPVSRLYSAWKDGRLRRKWMPETKLVIRTAQPDRSLRITWPDGTSVECWFTAKGPAKSSVQVQHTKLASKADAETRKVYWGERLDALGEMLK